MGSKSTFQNRDSKSEITEKAIRGKKEPLQQKGSKRRWTKFIRSLSLTRFKGSVRVVHIIKVN